MEDPTSDSREIGSESLKQDPLFQQQVDRLFRLTLYSRWILAISFWLLLAPLSLWGLRREIPLWRDHFTWTSLRYGLIYNPLSALGLALCMSATIAVLLRQTRYSLFGLSRSDRKQFEKKLFKIRQQGKTHPLWKWLPRQ